LKDISGAPMLSVIMELPHSREFSSAQDNYGNTSFLISAFNYTTITVHP